MTSTEIPISANVSAASITIRHIDPYVTTVKSPPSLKISGIPKGTTISNKLVGIGSLSRYPFKHSMTKPGSSPINKVRYIPAACVIFLGTQKCTPRNPLINKAIGLPECQIPSRRCPLVLKIMGAFWPPTVR